MKEKMIIVIITIGIVIGILIAGINLDSNNYKKAVAKCGTNNIQTNYTSQGDKYFTCKVNPR